MATVPAEAFLKEPINNLNDYIKFVHKLFARHAAVVRKPSCVFIGDCYFKLIEAQKKFIFQLDGDDRAVLRPGVQAVLEKNKMTWSMHKLRLSVTYMGPVHMAAFIPPADRS